MLEKRALSLQKAVDKAKDSELVKTDILKNVSRELRKPLTAMEHQVEILTEDINGLRADHRSSIELLRNNMNQMIRIVDALSMFDTSTTPRNMMSVDLCDLSVQAVARYEESFAKKSVSLVMEFQSEPLLARIDPEQIRQVLDILLSNAIRYSAGGDVKIKADIGQNGMVHVEVHDSGPGIDLEYKEKIFQPFYKPHTSSNYPHEGLGIGLSLAKEIVKSHGGEIWVKSGTSNGSEFHFTLPAAQGSVI
jgi:two-component system sensor histidine kinase VicK